MFAQAKRSSDPYFTVLYLPRHSGVSRIGFAIAKKRVARATVRNRLKRVSRESFRHNRDSFTTTTNSFDVVVLANRKAALASKRELFDSLDKHWRALSVYAKRTASPD